MTQRFLNLGEVVGRDGVRECLICGGEVMRVEHKGFDEWGLRTIQPFPHSALNFHGPPGTGKTLAAHAIAHTLKRSILVASSPGNSTISYVVLSIPLFPWTLVRASAWITAREPPDLLLHCWTNDL